MRSGPAGLVPSGSCGTTTTASVVAPGTLAIRPASPIVMVLDPTPTWAAPVPPTAVPPPAVPRAWAAAGVATAGRTVAALPDSAATGNRAPGAWSTTAAYRAGSTHITDTANPEDSDPVAVAAVAVATTPGTAETCCCRAGEISSVAGTAMMASAGTCCQDATTWACVTDELIMSGNATMASPSTSANDGRTEPGGVRVARARPTNATTPRDSPAIRASSRTRGGEQRSITPAASSTGAALVYRPLLPELWPSSLSTTSPPTATATSSASTTIRRTARLRPPPRGRGRGATGDATRSR